MLRLLLDKESDELHVITEDTFRAIEGDIFDTSVLIETLEDAKRNGCTITRILEAVDKFTQRGVQQRIGIVMDEPPKTERDIATQIIKRVPG